MCGLTGFWQPGGETEAVLRERLERMTVTLVHRGPDDEGGWLDAEAGIALGFRRLAIIDLSPTGHQPMVSADGRFVIIFNGEIYNYRELRLELQARGASFRGTSDTEVILAGTVNWGSEAVLPRLWGMFAIALWDRQERTLLLARDRVGKKPLYYAETTGGLLFGSELKALCAHPAFRADIDRDALTTYLRFGYVPAPFCIYRQAHKVPAGSYAIFQDGRLQAVMPYWEARQAAAQGLAERRAGLTNNEALAELDALLRDAVARRMISDVPLGALLSGGLDSSLVVALMQAQSAQPVKTFTIGFEVQGYNEAEQAKAVARHLQTSHTELYLTPADAQAVIPRLPELYDEPFADSSQVPTFLVYALARRHVTVSLSGDGGDEVFGGYVRYRWTNRLWATLSPFPARLRAAAAGLIERASLVLVDRLDTAGEPLLPDRWRQSLPGDRLHKLAELLAADGPDALYHRLMSLWKTPEVLAVGGHELPTPLTEACLRQSAPDFTERMMLKDLLTYLPDDILVKVDRASMGVGLEARAPLLDHRLVEWAWRQPLRLKMRARQGKWLLRQLLYRYVPQALVDRPKMGFGVPIAIWLRGELRDWAEALLDERRLRQAGYLNPAPVRAAWAGHLTGRQNESQRLWAVLMFEAWRERWQA
jgi:asparagine synthase (glutamine-hydrolysing)